MLGVFTLSLFAISTLMVALITFHVFFVAPLRIIGGNGPVGPLSHSMGPHMALDDHERHISVGGHHLNLPQLEFERQKSPLTPEFAGPGQDELDELSEGLDTDEMSGEDNVDT